MFTIKHAADVTGVPVATLRAWERRYGVVNPVRSDGGYRLYDEKSLGTIRAIRDLVAAGWSASQAAAEVVTSAVAADFDDADAADAAHPAAADSVAGGSALDDARPPSNRSHRSH